MHAPNHGLEVRIEHRYTGYLQYRPELIGAPWGCDTHSGLVLIEKAGYLPLSIWTTDKIELLEEVRA